MNVVNILKHTISMRIPIDRKRTNNLITVYIMIMETTVTEHD